MSSITPYVTPPGGSRGFGVGDAIRIGSNTMRWVKKIHSANSRYQAQEREESRIRQYEQEQGEPRRRLPAKKDIPATMKINVENRLVTRTAMKKVGKDPKVKKRLTVQVSKELRAAIKEVSKGFTAHGQYTRIQQGMIGSCVGFNATFNQNITVFGVNATALRGPSNLAPSGSRTWWGCLGNYVSLAAATVQADSELNFFTPTKILHAASVLFNNKGDSRNPYVSAGNLTTLYNTVDGAPTGLPSSLKIDIKESSVKFTIKNLSNRVVLLDMWELVPKIKFAAISPLASMVAQYAAYVETGATTTTTTQDNSFVYNSVNAAGTLLPNATMFHEGAIDPVSFISKWGFQWKGQKREMVLAPGETCVHYVSGPSGVLDYAKLFEEGLQAIPILGAFKGFSKSVMMSIRGDQALRAGALNAISTGERLGYSDGITSGIMGMPVAVEVEEYYDIRVPEIAGFLQPGVAFAAGNTVSLALRKNKKVVSSFVVTNPTTLTAKASNETNPAAEQIGRQDQ